MYSSTASSNFSMGHTLLTGITDERYSLFVLLRLTARQQGVFLSTSSLILGTTPEVLTVMRLAPMLNRLWLCSVQHTRWTCSRLLSGSPMPIKMMFVTWAILPSASRMPLSFRYQFTWRISSRISPASRFRVKPIFAVRQKAQFWAQPICVETHTEKRPFAGIMTVSMWWPSWVSKSHLTVPSVETRCWSSLRASMENCPASLSRSAGGTFTISSKLRTCWQKSHFWIWSARYCFSFTSLSQALSSSVVSDFMLCGHSIVPRKDRKKTVFC